jgi:hypothetical protein
MTQTQDRSSNVRWLIPPTIWGYVLSLLSASVGVVVYLARVGYDEFVMAAGLGLLFLLLPIVTVVGVCLIGLLVVLFTYARRTGGYIFPFLMLCGGLMAAWYAPLPLAAAEREFIKHRSEYETVVHLAATHRLAEHRECLYGLELPPEYRHLTQYCIQSVDKPALAIAFDPPTTRRLIIYAATPQALAALRNCCLDGSIYKQLDLNWYIFTEAQD